MRPVREYALLPFRFLVMLGLLCWVCLDLVPKRRKPVATPFKRTLPIPFREGGKVYVWMPDDSRVEIPILTAKTHAEAWNRAVMGVAVWEQTRIKD